MKQRIQLAEAGEWQCLARELLNNINCDSSRADHGNAGPLTDLRKYAKAVQKARGGWYRAAKNILVGPEPLAPSQATAQATKELFCTNPQEYFQQNNR